MRAGADLRTTRAAVFTAACVALSAAGHTLGGGTRIPLWTLALACAAVLAVTVPLAGRERSLPGIAALLALGQAGLHVLFAAAPVPGGASGGTAHAGHHGDRALVDLAGSLLCGEHAGGPIGPDRAHRIVAQAGLSPEQIAPAAAHGHGPDLGAAAGSLFTAPMLLGHLLAALAVGLLLRSGEAALWRLVRLSARTADLAAEAARETLTSALLHRARRLLRVLQRGLPATHVPARRTRERDRHLPGPHDVLLAHAVSRRGPPDPLTAAAPAFALAA